MTWLVSSSLSNRVIDRPAEAKVRIVAPLRLVAERAPLENAKGIWKETLGCGHVLHTFVDFFWDEKQHLILSEPIAKRRRCHECRDAIAVAVPFPTKKPCVSTKREKRERAA